MTIKYGFNSQLTETGKRLITVYAVIYILELIVTHWMNHPLVLKLMLWPFNTDEFKLWQLITHPLIHDPSRPIMFFIDCIILYFFMAPVEYALGTHRCAAA